MMYLPEEPEAADLRALKKVIGRRVAKISPRGLAAMHQTGAKANRWWDTRPAEKAERDRRFFTRRDETHTGEQLTNWTCSAVVRGRRCNRITIIETGHQHCIKHAGPARARLYRENQRKLFECGRLSPVKWFKDEQRRARTAVRDRQRRKKDGWMLPGVTLRFSEAIEARFRVDVAPLLPHPWSDIPDLHRDQLRWAWRRFMLDRQKPMAWDAKARAILMDLQGRRLDEVAELSHATGFEPHVLVCDRRATAFGWRSRLPQAEIDRALKAPAMACKAAAAATARAQGWPDGSPPCRPATRPATRLAVGDEAYERLLQRHGRDLRDMLARVEEAAWPALLVAYDAYICEPTAGSHHRWATMLRVGRSNL